MSKEYYYVVKWSQSDGWEIDPETESAHFPEGTVYDTQAGEWQLPYLGDGVFNGQEQGLTEALMDILNTYNNKEGESND